MIKYLQGKNPKSKKNYRTSKTLNRNLESVDTIVIIGATSNSTNLSTTGIGLIVLPLSARLACALTLGNEKLHKMIINKYNKYKKQNKKDQQNN